MLNKKILIVDDNSDFIELLEKKLQMEGFQAIKLTSGKEAVEKTKKYLPDLVLMDLMMPDIDGAEAARQIQLDPLTRNIPIIFLSGIVTPETPGAEPVLKVGDITYPAMGKPFTSQELMEKIYAVLKIKP